MSDPDGWGPAYRKVFEPDHWLAPTKRDPASRRDAWFDLVQMATWKPRETRSSGTLNRGELVVSIRTLAKRWKWHRCKVERFVSELRTRTATETVRETPDGTVLRIVAYDTYAVVENWKRDTQRDTKRDSGETAARQEQERKKLRRTDNPPLVPPPDKARKCALPDGWTPNDRHRSHALSAGLNMETEAEKFRASGKSVRTVSVVGGPSVRHRSHALS